MTEPWPNASGPTWHWAGFHWHMLAEKALYWQEQKALLIADAHLGKVTHFRKAGLGVPGAAAQNNWQRLQGLIDRWQPREVIFLGDLFHSEMNSEWLAFKSWMAAQPDLTFRLVMGNHDIFPAEVYQQSRLRCHPEPYYREGLALAHHPPETPLPEATLYGHLHPGVMLSGLGRQQLRLPCFYWQEMIGILPAFGAFTGLHKVPVKKQSSVFAIADARIMPVHEGLSHKTT